MLLGGGMEKTIVKLEDFNFSNVFLAIFTNILVVLMTTTTLRRLWTSFAIVSVPQESGGRERRCAHPGTGPEDFGEHAAEARGTAARRGPGIPGERVLGTDARRGETVDRGTEANVA